MFKSISNRYLKSIYPLGIILILLLTLISCAGNQKSSVDKDITHAIKQKFVSARGISNPDNIQLEAKDGVVTISGAIPSLLAKERTTRIAESVRGVQSVINDMTVDSTRSDSALVADVADAINNDPATDDFEISATVKNGTAILSGTVDSWQEKDLAATVVKGVKGVRDIENDITVNYKLNRPPEEIKKDVLGALKFDARIDAGMINVQVNKDEVILTGAVGSAREKSLAERDAHVIGVRKVDTSGLQVKPDERKNMQAGENIANLTDADIQEAIENAFQIDPRVDQNEVSVDVDSGVATISGTVDNLKTSRSAAEDAKNTLGISSVKNEIQVVPSSEFSDSTVKKQVIKGLNRDPYLDPANIEVSVNDGNVILSGQVESYFKKWEAGDIAVKVNGVVGITNNLKVNYTQQKYDYPYYDWDPIFYDYDYKPQNKSDAQLTKDIESHLKWSPFVSAKDITVTVKNGIVTLTGRVNTWFQANKAASEAYSAGAHEVINKLKFVGIPKY